MAGKPHFTAEQFIKAMPGTGGIISQIAQAVGCEWNTAKKYINQYATVKQAWENERNRITDKAQHNILKAIMDGDLPMSKWWLQVKDPEFKDRSAVDVTSGGKEITFVVKYDDAD